MMLQKDATWEKIWSEVLAKLCEPLTLFTFFYVLIPPSSAQLQQIIIRLKVPNLIKTILSI